MARRKSHVKIKASQQRRTVRTGRKSANIRSMLPIRNIKQTIPSNYDVRKIIVSPRRHPKQQGQEESLSGKRGTLRVTTDLTRCRTRKKYKKKMLKAIAAQMKRSGKGLSSWRRRRRQSTNIIYRC